MSDSVPGRVLGRGLRLALPLRRRRGVRLRQRTLPRGLRDRLDWRRLQHTYVRRVCLWLKIQMPQSNPSSEGSVVLAALDRSVFFSGQVWKKRFGLFKTVLQQNHHHKGLSIFCFLDIGPLVLTPDNFNVVMLSRYVMERYK